MDLVSKLQDFSTKSVQRRKELDDFIHISPMERTRNEVTSLLEKSEKYRVSILKNISVFQHLSSDNLFSLALCLEEIKFRIGDIIFKQDEISDCLFILVKGRAVATVSQVSYSNYINFIFLTVFYTSYLFNP